MNRKKIGLALSGGGIRAVAFHSGVLKRLAEEGLLEKITDISSVSGGSLLIGLVYSLNKNKWPSSEIFLNKVLPEIRNILTTKNIELGLFLKSIVYSVFTLRIWRIFFGKANILSTVLRQKWGITSEFNTIPIKPCWHVNATCYETGKRWRFKSNSEFKMGDYKFGYTRSSKLYLSDVIACSAAFPILIGTFVINTKKYKWHRYSDYENRIIENVVPKYNKLHLWDGGVYDNNGIEALFKKDKYQGDFDFLIISEASQKIKEKKKKLIPKDLRLIDIMMNQIKSIKTRLVMDHFTKNKGQGLYFHIGNDVEYIKKAANKQDDKSFLTNNPLAKDKVERVTNYPTRLYKMKSEDFDIIMQHGWEVAHYTMKAYV